MREAFDPNERILDRVQLRRESGATEEELEELLDTGQIEPYAILTGREVFTATDVTKVKLLLQPIRRRPGPTRKLRPGGRRKALRRLSWAYWYDCLPTAGEAEEAVWGPATKPERSTD